MFGVPTRVSIQLSLLHALPSIQSDSNRGLAPRERIVRFFLERLGSEGKKVLDHDSTALRLDTLAGSQNTCMVLQFFKRSGFRGS